MQTPILRAKFLAISSLFTLILLCSNSAPPAHGKTPEATPVNSVFDGRPDVPLPWECPPATKTVKDVRRIVQHAATGSASERATPPSAPAPDQETIERDLVAGVQLTVSEAQSISLTIRQFYACENGHDILGKYSLATDYFIAEVEQYPSLKDFDNLFQAKLVFENEARQADNWESGPVIHAWTVGPLLAGSHIAPDRIEVYLAQDILRLFPVDRGAKTVLSAIIRVELTANASGVWRVDSVASGCLADETRRSCA